ncbi:hypothetical protein OPV22_000403 [Ensete ventricosum]|uniref:SREBP regulating gene protein n=1 Tax=Ensete ventricosum TaxID=4639 RepID=A0AAV8RU84_ENSVE|nr:hypothetical protein OPV22_000403 [Ensete ventricosum]
MEMERKVNPDCINASNPFHVCGESCVQRSYGSNTRSPLLNLAGAAQAGNRRKEDRGNIAAERNVDLSCPNASNPYHQCDGYCFSRNPAVNGQKEKRSAQNGGIQKENQGFAIAEKNVNPSCLNATNPYHQCAEYCSPKKSEEVKSQNKERRSVENGVKMQDNRMIQREQIHPNCVNASNPYHKCGEYCFQKISQSS